MHGTAQVGAWLRKKRAGQGAGVAGLGQGLQGPLSTVTGSALMAPAPRGKLRAQRRPHRRAGELILKLIVQRLPQTVVALLFQTRAVSLKYQSEVKFLYKYLDPCTSIQLTN